MTLDFNHFAHAARTTMALPEVLEDAMRCNARVEWEVLGQGIDKADRKIVVWEGAADGKTIVLMASAAVWEKIFSALPAPGYQSLGALRRQCPEFKVIGDDLTIAQALPFIERLLEQCRMTLHPGKPQKSWDKSVLAHISGHYLPIDAEEQEWVYAEQSGNEDGLPLLMLHTAGADTRQWHGLMGQAALRKDWRMHAFDLPGHGRSPLPSGAANWNWRLTEADYMHWVIAYMDAAKIERATLAGCSMGSAIGLALLAKYPHRFNGAVLLETPYHSPGRRSKYLNHSEVHGSRLAAAWVGSLLSPSSPQSGRDLATWIYSQGAPGVYDGDLAYYSDDFNAHDLTAAIDTQRTPLWMLTGNYDYSATPADSQRVADEIKGAQFKELSGFGHFPMVENPVGLLPHFQQALESIRSQFSSKSK